MTRALTPWWIATLLLTTLAGRPAGGGGEPPSPPEPATGVVAPKIVGGGPAGAGQNRWISSLQSGGHFCGASLLDDRWAVTAAHCVIGEQASKLTLWVGGYDLRKPQGGVQVKVAKIHIHPSYNDNTLRNDIALLQLQSSVSQALPRAVPANANITQQLAKPAKIVTVSGWGTLSENGPSPFVLHEVRLPVVSHGECKAAYGGDVHSTQICAGLAAGGKDSCQGDSGGPLWASKQGKDYLVGIVSWGEGCAQPRRYGVYTRVASYVGWIDSKMKGGGSQESPNDPQDPKPDPPPGPQPGPERGSCQGSCGGKAKGCWCDVDCAFLGDCCPDYEQVCDTATDSCTNIVCDLDPYCCQVEWDFLCEEVAADEC